MTVFRNHKTLLLYPYYGLVTAVHLNDIIGISSLVRTCAWTWRSEQGPHSDGHGADDDPVLQHDTQHQEDEVQQKHGGAQQLVHLPLAPRDGDDDEEEHQEEQHDGTEESITADRYRGKTVEGRI